MPKSRDNTDESSKNRRQARKDSRFKNKIAKDGYDYYAVLGFTEKTKEERSQITSKDIMKAYNKQLRKYHPDRIDKDISKNELKQLNSMYKLVQQAGEVLSDKSKRKAFDLEHSMKESSGFLNQRDKFEEFMKLQEQEDTEDNRGRAKLDFEKGLAELNKKHGADKYSTTSMSKDDTNRKLEDLMEQRDIEGLEIRPTRMFAEGAAFDRNAFMRNFEKDKLRRNRRKGVGKRDGDIIKYDDIGAFNDTGPGFGINDDYGGLYTEEKFKGNSKFGGINNSDESDSDQNSDDGSIDSNEIDDRYFRRDNAISSSDMNKALDKLTKERDDENNLYGNKSYDGYQTSMKDKFGVSHGLGFMVGTDFKGSQVQKKTAKHLESEEINAYKKIIGYESDDSDESDDSYDIDA